MHFNKVNLSINDYRILAESLSVSQNANIEPGRAANLSRPFEHTPSNFRGQITLNYIVEPSVEPNYLISNQWKQATTGNTLSIITLGGIRISGYLSSYSLSVLPHEPVRASATYDYFNLITGNWTLETDRSTSNLHNIANGQGVAHYWSTYMMSGSTESPNHEVIQADYQINFEVVPSYGLGNAFPKQINVISAKENLSLQHESQINLDFTGNRHQLLIPSFNSLKLKTLSSTWTPDAYEISIPMAGMQVTSNSMNVTINNLMLYSTNLEKHY